MEMPAIQASIELRVGDTDPIPIVEFEIPVTVTMGAFGEAGITYDSTQLNMVIAAIGKVMEEMNEQRDNASPPPESGV